VALRPKGATMHEVSLWEAWSIWLSGSSVSDQILWGMRILWWGRLGKALGLLAGLTVLLEVIGPERLRQFGPSLHNALNLRDMFRVLLTASLFVLRDTHRIIAGDWVVGLADWVAGLLARRWGLAPKDQPEGSEPWTPVAALGHELDRLFDENSK